MRTVMIATALLALATADAAVAGAVKRTRVPHAAAALPAALPDTYRRPTRGWALPPYWQSSRFAVTDWRALGLREPLPGYRWVRYHDDAVLVDRNFSIFDVAPSVARSGGDPFYANDDRVFAGPGERYIVAPPAPVAPPRPWIRAQPEPEPEPVYAADDEPPIASDRMPPPPVDYAQDEWVSPDGRTVVTTRGDARRYGGSVTTVTIGPATTTTTTTTTETYDGPVARPGRLQRSKTFRAPRT